MRELAQKVRLATLWIVAAVAFGAYRLLALSADAVEVSLLNDRDFASYLLVVLILAYLAVTLPVRLNRLVNLIAGGIVGILQAIVLIDGFVGYPDASFNLMTAVTVVATWSVAWFAYRWHEPTPDVTAAEQDLERRRTPAGV